MSIAGQPRPLTLRRRAALVLAGLIILQGCATLPGTENEMAVPHAKKVEFQGPNGPVSCVKSAAILDRLEDEDDTSEMLRKHLAYEQAINADSPLSLGNELILLQNGPATYQAMFAAIRRARDHINLETYVFDEGEAGTQFSDLLLDRQAAGVQVNGIYGSVGGLMTSGAFFDRLRDGAIEVLEFNPLNPLSGNKKEWLVNNRDHRRQL